MTSSERPVTGEPAWADPVLVPGGPVVVRPLDLGAGARPGDRGQAAAVATRAFHHDPLFEHLEPRALERSRGLGWFWLACLEASGPRARCYGAWQGERLLGVSVWFPPGAYPLPLAGQARELLGGLRALWRRPPGLLDGLRYLLAIDRAHPKEELWYLFLLVVDPLVQRCGLGARLQAPGMAAADAEGLDCYLETQKAENLPYYRRFGYEVLEELRPAPSGPPMWTMRRPAGAAPRAS
ncbi:GNAT family N-acetyltransferase [Aciditerrimonas ferrireducens]|uniref:GNAT family N-acetyltransferase n=1 Tax=Aciditerrimonas ferrireducens TaxID=667306 RepID=A0ABV6C0Z2_9ACTN